jgi:beta-lactamase class D
MKKILLSCLILTCITLQGIPQQIDIPWHNQQWYDSLNIDKFTTYKVQIKQQDTIIEPYSEYVYNCRKNKLQIEYFGVNGKRIKKASRNYFFNQCGVLIEKTNSDELWINQMCCNAPDTTYRFGTSINTNDSLGRLIGIISDTVYVGNGLYHSSYKTFIYDSLGYLTESYQHNRNGNDTISTTTIGHFSHDEFGRLILITTISTSQKTRKTHKSWLRYKGTMAELYSLTITKEIKPVENKIVKPEFQSIIDSANVEGAILVYDFEQDKYYSNDFEWTKKGQLPASTFKIPNSIIALEIGIVKNDSTLFKWDGKKRGYKIWEQDLIFKDAFHYSCVPCYQEVAKEIGFKRMKEYLDLFNYGSIIVDSVTIDNFWMEGDSRINQFQQIDFLKTFYQSQLSISERTVKIMKRMMVIEENSAFKLSGKTGWSYSNGIENGWFVGYIESKGMTYFFATNIEPKENLNMELFPKIRKDVTFKAFQELRIID